MLSFPYADDREMVVDILRFGADVEVVGPAALRGRIKRMLHETVGLYVTRSN